MTQIYNINISKIKRIEILMMKMMITKHIKQKKILIILEKMKMVRKKSKPLHIKQKKILIFVVTNIQVKSFAISDFFSLLVNAFLTLYKNFEYSITIR